MGREVVVLSRKSSKSAPANTAAAGLDKDGKKEKRKTRQAKAGLSFGVNKAHKLLASKWRGKVSTDASVVLAASLQHLSKRLLKDARAAADVGIAPVKEGEKQTHRKVNSAFLQIALTKNKWLSQYIAKGRVVGSAPATTVANPEDNEDDSSSSSSQSGESDGSSSE